MVKGCTSGRVRVMYEFSIVSHMLLGHLHMIRKALNNVADYRLALDVHYRTIYVQGYRMQLDSGSTVHTQYISVYPSVH